MVGPFRCSRPASRGWWRDNSAEGRRKASNLPRLFFASQSSVSTTLLHLLRSWLPVQPWNGTKLRTLPERPGSCRRRGNSSERLFRPDLLRDAETKTLDGPCCFISSHLRDGSPVACRRHPSAGQRSLAAFMASGWLPSASDGCHTHRKARRFCYLYIPCPVLPRSQGSPGFVGSAVQSTQSAELAQLIKFALGPAGR